MKRLNRLRFRQLLCLAAFCAVAATSSASVLDATITIDHALNSPTITVRYSGASASMIELLLNGQSIATRTLSAKNTKGETTFTLDLAALRDGDNNLEVRLYDSAGHMVGSEKNVVSTDDGTPSPFFISNPKMGESLQGPVEIKLGFGQNFTSSNISFFIDNRFVLMTNTPPFTYLWDTAREKNGWHELESWLVDDTSTTYKTRRVRVFVNNPSGNTNRHFLTFRKQPELATKPNTIVANPVGTTAGPRTLATPGATVASLPNVAAQPVSISQLVLIEALNATNIALVGTPASVKATAEPHGVSTGPKYMTPTGNRNANAVAMVAKTGAKQTGAIEPLVRATRLLPITKGSRLAGLKTFSVLLNDEFVSFDVQPRVDEGVPMTPLRYLLEKDGGKVTWDNGNKTVFASAEGHDLTLHIGDTTAHVDKLSIQMERAPYLLSSRTMIPLSFFHDALGLEVDYDKTTGHVLISSQKK
jgi:hypothetical protein